MARYDPETDPDRDGWGGGFEDPRFANGRRPDDDNDNQTFGGSFNAGASRGGGGRRFGCGCFLTLLGLGAIATVVCCGGMAWFGANDRGERVVAALAADPALQGQLEEALGPDYRLTPDLAASLDAPAGAVVFEASGPRGSGTLTALSRRAREIDPNAAPRAVAVLGGTLELEDGRTIELDPDAPPPQADMRERLEQMRQRLEEMRRAPRDAPAAEEGLNGEDQGLNGDDPEGELSIDASNAADAFDR